MQDNNIPVKFAAIWASTVSAPYITAGGIPIASQQGVKNGAASFTDGFPRNCFIPIATGGAGPYGADFNAILQQITAWQQWAQAGAPIPYDAAFSTAIGGYPNGALVASATTAGLWWRSTVESNTSNPDTGGANWLKAYIPGAINNVSGSGGINTDAGYAQLTNGLIIQWQTLNNQSLQTTVTYNFPIAFPNHAIWSFAQLGYLISVTSNVLYVAAQPISNTQFNVDLGSPNPGGPGTGLGVISIGF